MKDYKFSDAWVVSCRETPRRSGIFLIKFKWEITAEPGQFMLIHPMPGVPSRHIMPRPFSIYDCDEGTVSILVKVVGPNTHMYSTLKPGNLMAVSGPHGKPIPLKPGFDSPNYILVAGGFGMAPMHFLAKKLNQQRRHFSVLVGCRDRSSAVDMKPFREFSCQTKLVLEQGTRCNGLVTDLLEEKLQKKEHDHIIVTCGPKPMLKAVADIAARHQQRCLIMPEEVMACGVGSCKGCAIFQIDGSVRHICTDGPALNPECIDWQKFLPTKIPSIQVGKKSQHSMRTILKSLTSQDLIMSSPIINASGCLSIEAVENGQVDIDSCGALVTKGVTLEPRAGNVMPRTCEVPGGMINSIGLENPGVEKFIHEELPRWLRLKKPIIVNISGFSPEEYAKIATHLVKTRIAAIEINVSCPNIKQGGSTFGLFAEMTGEIVQKVRKAAPEKFLIVKLSPMASDIVAIARAATQAGADAISGINTLLGMSINIWTRRIRLGNRMGGVSGTVIHPMAVRIIYQLAQAKLGIPLIGMGGIRDGETAAEMLLAGANAIAVGTELFANPLAMSIIHNHLIEIMHHHQLNHIQELVSQTAV